MPAKFSSDPSSGDSHPPEEKYFWLLLYAPNKKGKFGAAIKGNLWLQKDMFLLTKSIDDLKELKFDEHILGPFSPVVQSVQIQHANSGLIKQSLDNNGPITLTEKGVLIAKKVWESASAEEKARVSNIKRFMNEMDFHELIAFIYSSFPETTTNSDVVGEFQKTRLDAAVRLLQRDMVSLERAATIAGKSLEELMEILKQRKVKVQDADLESFKEDLKHLESLS